MKKVIWTSNMPPKGTTAAMAALSFAAAFLVLFFSPFDMYLHNPTGFVVGWKFLVPVLSLITLGAFCGIFIVLTIIWYREFRIGMGALALCGVAVTCLRFGMQKFPLAYPWIMAALALCCLLWAALTKLFEEYVFDIAMLLLSGATIAMYAQLMFFNGDMVRITGDQADYSQWTVPHMMNLLLWIALCVLPLVVWFVLRKNNTAIQYHTSVIAISVIFVGMQSAGLIATATAAELPPGMEEEDVRYLSFEPLTKLSTKENILVFLLDRFDADYMAATLETYPELAQDLDGFTFYRNNTSEYRLTFPSVCTMLTGHYYEYGQPFSEYWDQAWAGDTFVGKLKKAGFSTNLSLDHYSTYRKNSHIEKVADNLRKAEDWSASFGGTLKVTAKLSLGRTLPYSLKNIFLNGLNATFGNRFYRMSSAGGEWENAGISPVGDMKFYNYISQFPVTPEAKAKTFHFIHLNASHVDLDQNVRTEGYHFNNTTGAIEPEGNFLETTHACLKILNTYFEQMKAGGVYDNTAIIVVGDHGTDFSPGAEKYRGMVTGLLIKPRKARGALKTDITAELSNAYFGNSLLDLAGVDYEGVSYFDIIEGRVSTPPRKFYHTSEWVDPVTTFAEKVSLLKTYEITGDANDWANWKPVESSE